MENWVLYVLGIISAVLVGGLMGYFIIVCMDPFSDRSRTGFRRRIEEIDKKLKEMEENPVALLELEIERMNERIEKLEVAISKGEILAEK